jgi:hypothetical protein
VRGRAEKMSAMALGQAVAGMSLLSSSSGGKQAGLLDAASGLRRCKADCVRLAAFTVPQRMEQRLKLGEYTFAFFAAVAVCVDVFNLPFCVVLRLRIFGALFFL